MTKNLTQYTRYKQTRYKIFFLTGSETSVLAVLAYVLKTNLLLVLKKKME